MGMNGNVEVLITHERVVKISILMTDLISIGTIEMSAPLGMYFERKKQNYATAVFEFHDATGVFGLIGF